MRTKINWPATGYEMGGLMGFSAEWIGFTAAEYKVKIKPIVEKAIVNLEQEIDQLKFELAELRKVKPTYVYNHQDNTWVPKDEPAR